MNTSDAAMHGCTAVTSRLSAARPQVQLHAARPRHGGGRLRHDPVAVLGGGDAGHGAHTQGLPGNGNHVVARVFTFNSCGTQAA